MKNLVALLIVVVFSSQSFAQITPEKDLFLDYKFDVNKMGEPDEVVIPPQRKAAMRAMGSSILIPGLGQLQNRQWVKAGIMAAIEAAAVFYHFDRKRTAQTFEDEYHAFGDANFSVVKYADWLIGYNTFFGTSSMTLQDLALPGQVIDPSNLAVNTRADWSKVDIRKLRELENNTLFAGSFGNAFSHVMPDYGSQQYYELMSKYFQFGPGWKDFSKEPGPMVWDRANMTENWVYHGYLGRTFNDDYRAASMALNIIVLNHAVAALDAYIVRSKKVHVTANISSNEPALLYGLRLDF